MPGSETIANPATENSQTSEVSEGKSGDFLDGLLSQPTKSGNASQDANQRGSEADAGKAVGQSQPPLTDETAPASKPEWTAQLKKELRDKEGLTKFQTISDLGNSYLELEGRLGHSVVIPGKDAPQEEWQAYYKQIGRPENPENYVLDRPEGVSEEQFTPEGTKPFRDMAYKAGLTQNEANIFFKELTRVGAENLKNIRDENEKAKAERAKECEVTLKKEWGKDFNSKLEQTKRVISAYGNPEFVKEIKDRGLASSPCFMNFLAQLGGELKEDRLVSGNNASDTNTGFTYPGL